MAQIGSAVPLVVDALETKLVGLGLTDIAGHALQVIYGLDRAPDRERIAIGDITNWSQDWSTATSSRARKEAFTIEMWVVTCLPGDAQKEATDRNFGQLAVISAGLRADLTLGLGADHVTNLELRPTRERKGPVDGGGRYSVIETGVRVEARI